MYNESSISADTAKTLSEYMAGTFSDYEIIFSDDGSKDGSADIVNGLELPCVRVVGYENNSALVLCHAEAEISHVNNIQFKQIVLF